jgi:hypothetical protein
MAKKKTKKSAPRRKHPHRVSGVKPGSVEHYALMGLGAIGGGLAAAYLVQAGQTALGASTPLSVAPGIVAAGGVGLVVLAKGNALAEGAGLGMAAVGGVMFANETFLNVPGISGPPAAFSSNALPETPIVRQAVGRATYQTNGMKRVGAGPNAYLNQTVGATRHSKLMKLGMLASN